MNLRDTIGATVPGRNRKELDLIPAHLFYETEAPERLAEALKTFTSGRTALVLFDARTREISGLTCAAALRSSGWQVAEHVISDPPGGPSPVCDDITKNRLQADTSDADVYIAVGSGVVNDLTKWLAVEAGKPYAVLATAASMNGYAAANVAPSINGVKSLFKACAPRIVAAVPEVIENAPALLTTAGLGDVIAKPVSTMDWIMNNIIFDEDFSEEIAGIINDVEPLYLARPEAMAEKDPGAIKALLEALVLSGCAMTLQGSSLPASGGEHLVSHTLDMKAHVDGIPHDLHGRQVGLCTIVASALYERVLAIETPDFKTSLPPFDPDYWGPIASAVEKQHILATTKAAAAVDFLEDTSSWDTLRSRLAPGLRPPANTRACLEKAGGAYRLEDIGCTRDQFCAAVRYAPFIRERFTSLDLAYAVGILPDAIEEIVDEWLV